MRTLGRILLRAIFWSYERGTWPYDLMVLAIVLFVLFSPRVIHYNDQPQIGPPPSAAQVELLSANDMNGTRVYRVDARLLVSPVRTQAFDRELHDVIHRNVQDLRGRTFQILRYEAVRGENGNVVYYDITVKP